jgi:hypothetical protein
MMECTVCKVMVRKEVYHYCHSHRDTSGDDSEGGAHAKDHDAHRFVYCTECKRNVTLAQSLNLSCHTYCLDCRGDGPHDNCIKHNSRATSRKSAKPMLCLTCIYYVSEDDYRTGRCHGGISRVINPVTSLSSVPVSISGIVSSYNTTNMSFSAPVSVSGDISLDHRNTGYQHIGGDVMCMFQTREQRRHVLHVYQKAEMERFHRKCERELKEDYDAN